MVTRFYPPDWRRLCEELVDELNSLSAHLEGTTPFGKVLSGLRTWNRARAALAQSESEPVGPTDEELWQVGDEDFRANTWPTDAIRYARAVLARFGGRPAPAPAEGEVAKLVAEIRHFLAGYQQIRGLDPEHIYSIHRGDAMEAHIRVSRLSRIADLLERPAPVPAGDVVQAYQAGRRDAEADARQAAEAAEGEPAEDVGELVAWLRRQAVKSEAIDREVGLSHSLVAEHFTRTADLLERQAAPVPVAVSERLPHAEDCDADGFIWLWDCDRRWVRQRRAAASSNTWTRAHWLPGWFLPLPSGEVE